jgi:hypothetical protein
MSPKHKKRTGEKTMHSTQNAVANHEYRSVPITALAESATNPRKRFDAKSLEEPNRAWGMDVSFSERHITRTTET